MAYQKDYEVNSTTADGAKTRGSVYIRGLKDKEGYDSFKFILEKAVDFCDLDIQIVLKAIEEAFKPKIKPTTVYEKGGSKKLPGIGKSSGKPGAKKDKEKAIEEDDPHANLENLGCTVFMPD